MADTTPQSGLTKASPVRRSTATANATGFEIHDLIPSWRVHLVAVNRADTTIRDYIRDTEKFADWLAAKGMPTDVGLITAEHFEAHIADVQERTSPSTAASAHRRIRQFWRWLHEEGEITSNPLAHLTQPYVPDQPPEVRAEEDVRKLLDVCRGTDFRARRDMAIIRVLLDTGGRRKEVSGLELPDVDLRAQGIELLGKGGTKRIVPVGAKTAQALDRYLRARRKHPYADLTWLWLGLRGRFGYWGLGQMLEARSEQAGIENFHPHLWRHLFSHRWLVNGGHEGDLMMINGWATRDMVDRYGRSAAAERARQAHRKMALGDDF